LRGRAQVEPRRESDHQEIVEVEIGAGEKAADECRHKDPLDPAHAEAVDEHQRPDRDDRLDRTCGIEIAGDSGDGELTVNRYARGEVQALLIRADSRGSNHQHRGQHQHADGDHARAESLVPSVHE